jgi:oligopeptide transport system substrate-binding protein
LETARQHLAAVRRLAACGAVALLAAGCGSSSHRAAGSTFRLALPLVPHELDPARAPDLPSANVAHELYAGLTRFTANGVEPDLASSWDVSRGGLVWTFHLRPHLRWSDDRAITAQDFRRSWLRALARGTKAPLAGPALGIVRGSRAYHATGAGQLGVQALDAHTLRVTLQHPIPWLDELVAYPIAFPVPPRPGEYSGPFRLDSQSGDQLVLGRNFNYWNARAVKPSTLVFTAKGKGADVILPRGAALPGLPWIETASPPSGPGWTALPTLSVHLLWLATRTPALADPVVRADIASVVGDSGLDTLVPDAMPGRSVITSGPVTTFPARSTPVSLTLGYTTQDPEGRATALQAVQDLSARGFHVTPLPFATLSGLLGANLDLVLLGWSAKVRDEYNILDLFPCGSAFNVAHWCDPTYDALMRRTVRTLRPASRYRLEQTLLGKLRRAVPAVPLAGQTEWVRLGAGVHGFEWSPVGFYELDGLTRS